MKVAVKIKIITTYVVANILPLCLQSVDESVNVAMYYQQVEFISVSMSRVVAIYNLCRQIREYFVSPK